MTCLVTTARTYFGIGEDTAVGQTASPGLERQAGPWADHRFDDAPRCGGFLASFYRSTSVTAAAPRKTAERATDVDNGTRDIRP